MSPSFVLVLLVGGAMLSVSCGDDANDHALQLERAAQRAAELRAAPVETTPPTAPSTMPAAASAPENSTLATTAPTTEAPQAVEPTGVVVPVQAIDNTFRPQVIEINLGDEVLWENRGLNDHDVLYVDGDDWGVEVEGFGPGAVYAHIFTAPGEYRYYCSIHGNETVGMVGTIIVTG